MIRLHLKRRVQVGDQDVTDECRSMDIEVPDLERLLDEEATGYGSVWFFVGIERLIS